MEIKKRENQKITKRKDGSLDIGTINEEPSMTQQQYKDSCDINNIIKQYHQTGELPLSKKVGAFLDVSDVQDYQSSLHTVFEAQRAFDQLPSKIRSRFENDPNQLIAFLEDANNLNEATELGLIDAKSNTNVEPKPNPKPNTNDESKP